MIPASRLQKSQNIAKITKKTPPSLLGRNTILQAIIYEPDGTSKIDENDSYSRHYDDPNKYTYSSNNNNMLFDGQNHHDVNADEGIFDDSNNSIKGSHGGEHTPSSLSSSSLVDAVNNYSRNHKDVLARLAVAFSPTSQKVKLQQIDDIHILDIDDHHIDIEAVVCEEDSCITLMVPVEFPHPCHNNDGTTPSTEAEHCIVDNLDELDDQAMDELQLTQQEEKDWMTTQENELLKSWEDLESFIESNKNSRTFPSWWVPCLTLEQDCQSIKQLLNDQHGDYDTELKALATYALQTIRGNHDALVQHAAVVDICPAGIYIRAKVLTSSTTNSDNDNNDRGLNPPYFGSGNEGVGGVRKKSSREEQQSGNKIVEVPIPFRMGVAHDSSNLQAAILDIISSAMEYTGMYI